MKSLFMLAISPCSYMVKLDSLYPHDVYWLDAMRFLVCPPSSVALSTEVAPPISTVIKDSLYLLNSSRKFLSVCSELDYSSSGETDWHSICVCWKMLVSPSNAAGSSCKIALSLLPPTKSSDLGS
jgi:hypothetical protein